MVRNSSKSQEKIDRGASFEEGDRSLPFGKLWWGSRDKTEGNLTSAGGPNRCRANRDRHGSNSRNSRHPSVGLAQKMKDRQRESKDRARRVEPLIQFLPGTAKAQQDPLQQTARGSMQPAASWDGEPRQQDTIGRPGGSGGPPMWFSDGFLLRWFALPSLKPD